MSDGDATPTLRGLVGSAGVYVAAALAQRGVGLVLLPLYTRALTPTEYGMLEIFNTVAAVVGAVLGLGLASSIIKVLHADCATETERRAVLATAVWLDLPLLLLGAAAALVAAEPLAVLLVGAAAAADCVRLLAGTMVCATIWSLALATLRARERALAFGALSVAQFVLTAAANILLTGVLGWGLRGILLGTLCAQVLALPAALWVAGRGAPLLPAPHLVRPLLRFGVLLLPMMLAGFAMDVSDRWVLRATRTLDEVAVYAVGYKLGGLLDTALVWPFQLAWPAFAFAASRRAGHRESWARAFTYLVLVLSAATLAAALLAPVLLPWIAGESYRAAATIVPLVALAYACNGVQFFFSPAVQLGGQVRSLAWFAPLAALLNVGLALLLVPRFGMYGAALATLAAFALLATLSLRTAQRVYPIALERGRLGLVIGAAAAVYGAVTLCTPAGTAAAVLLAVAGLVAFPLLLAAAGFLREPEWVALRALLRRVRPSSLRLGWR
ncbi:MAG: lipopolysaccharide biosynthesis protein [Deltaproteobacteria bacterium]|nr:lipopolysaccharide biosynthesis protein [Deltaproteobacteria bacterium]